MAGSPSSSSSLSSSSSSWSVAASSSSSSLSSSSTLPSSSLSELLTPSPAGPQAPSVSWIVSDNASSPSLAPSENGDILKLNGEIFLDAVHPPFGQKKGATAVKLELLSPVAELNTSVPSAMHLSTKAGRVVSEANAIFPHSASSYFLPPFEIWSSISSFACANLQQLSILSSACRSFRTALFSPPAKASAIFSMCSNGGVKRWLRAVRAVEGGWMCLPKYYRYPPQLAFLRLHDAVEVLENLRSMGRLHVLYSLDPLVAAVHANRMDVVNWILDNLEHLIPGETGAPPSSISKERERIRAFRAACKFGRHALLPKFNPAPGLMLDGDSPQESPIVLAVGSPRTIEVLLELGANLRSSLRFACLHAVIQAHDPSFSVLIRAASARNLLHGELLDYVDEYVFANESYGVCQTLIECVPRLLDAPCPKLVSMAASAGDKGWLRRLVHSGKEFLKVHNGGATVQFIDGCVFRTVRVDSRTREVQDFSKYDGVVIRATSSEVESGRYRSVITEVARPIPEMGFTPKVLEINLPQGSRPPSGASLKTWIEDELRAQFGDGISDGCVVIDDIAATIPGAKVLYLIDGELERVAAHRIPGLLLSRMVASKVWVYRTDYAPELEHRWQNIVKPLLRVPESWVDGLMPHTYHIVEDSVKYEGITAAEVRALHARCGVGLEFFILVDRQTLEEGSFLLVDGAVSGRGHVKRVWVNPADVLREKPGGQWIEARARRAAAETAAGAGATTVNGDPDDSDSSSDGGEAGGEEYPGYCSLPAVLSNLLEPDVLFSDLFGDDDVNEDDVELGNSL
ncbi:hypothetical protein DFJ73DRAFT_839942 [Zopfochytrium polystomum]|nr:hypothetical protein DFJ73DRAFT_839942 [Zopfochytrium polystomum]